MRNLLTGKIFIPAGVVLMFLLAPFVAVQTTFVQREIVAQLLQQVEESSGYAIQVGSFHWSSLSTLVLRDIEASVRGNVDLEAGGLRLLYRLSVFPVRIHLEQIHVDAPVVRVRQDSRGDLTYPLSDAKETASPSSGGPPRWLAWKGAVLTVASGAVLGVAGNGDVLFQTKFSGEFQLEKLVGGGLQHILPNLESVTRRGLNPGDAAKRLPGESGV